MFDVEVGKEWDHKLVAKRLDVERREKARARGWCGCLERDK